MRIGIPTEIKPQEGRVALTPNRCAELVKAGHDVFIQAGAGDKSGYDDDQFKSVGVHIAENAKSLYEKAELIVKVKEPLEQDLSYLTKDHTLFCYLHLAADPKLVDNLKNIGLNATAFETVVKDGSTPLLAPMSAIAGRLSVQIGARVLHAPEGGRGTLIGGITGHKTGNVTVIGAGVAGTEAAILAHGMGAHVRVLDINGQKLQEMSAEYPDIEWVVSTESALEELLPETDILVGSVYVIGRKAPTVVTEDQIKLMPKGSVVVDISIDQGGCIETSCPCTHEDPTYVNHGVVHSAITNMPAAAPRTASEVLSKAILPYVKQIADDDWSDELKEAVNVDNGKLLIEL